MSFGSRILAGSIAVSPIGQGTALLGQRLRDGSLDEATAVGLIHHAVDCGINLFDTAENYGDGASETVLGRALRGRRGACVVATKFSPSNSSRQKLIAACENSLARLGVEALDILQAHWPNPAVPIDETVETLVSLVRAGKVRAVGFSNATTVLLRKIRRILPADVPFAVVQQEYSLIERFVEHRCLPFVQENGCQLLAYSPLAQGKLVSPLADTPLARLARETDTTPAILALSWLLRRPNVIPIPETSRPEGIQHYRDAIALDAPEDVYRQLDRAYASRIEEIPVDQIRVVSARANAVFKSMEEALANTLSLSPSPVELAKELKDGEMLKPVKVRPRPDEDGVFDLYEGQLRFWAWQIAHGRNAPITALVDTATRSPQT